MSNATDVTTAEFDAAVASGVTLVDFWAEWCGPCRMMAPTLDQIAVEYAGKAKVIKVNVDNESDLAIKYEVQSIPTFLVFKNGRVTDKFIGVTGKDTLADALDRANG